MVYRSEDAYVELCAHKMDSGGCRKKERGC